MAPYLWPCYHSPFPRYCLPGLVRSLPQGSETATRPGRLYRPGDYSDWRLNCGRCLRPPICGSTSSLVYGVTCRIRSTCRVGVNDLDSPSWPCPRLVGTTCLDRGSGLDNMVGLGFVLCWD